MSIVSVNILGGLGNQMFQIATAYAYAKKYNGVLKIRKNKLEDDKRPLYWDSILKNVSPYLVDNINTNELQKWYESCPTEYKQIPPLPKNGIYLNGYLQSEKYFKDIKQEIKQLFCSPESSLEYINTKFKSLLENKNRIVVVHARRTDYLKNKHNIMFHGPLTVDYYKTAVKNMCKLVENPFFLLSSDDSSYWSEIFNDIPEFNKENTLILTNENEINTLTLLQQFHYFIIANSTFSWWAT